MSNESYNGWRNRSTWLINLWFSPNPSDLEWIQESLEERVNELSNSGDIMDQFLADHINLQEIDWQELAEHLEEEVDDE